MSNLARKLMGTTSGDLNIADAFSIDLYTGNGGLQTITNGLPVDLAILKRRDAAGDWGWFDTDRGVQKWLASNTTNAETTDADTLTAFNVDGFSLGADAKFNTSASTNVAFSLVRKPRFFDRVTYTGDGVAGRTVAHNLGVAPGMIVVKRRDAASNWPVYHRSNTAAPETDYLELNDTVATVDSAAFWNDTAPTDSVFTVGTNADVNASGGTYDAYLFAHDTDAAGVIQCGSYTGNGSTTGPTITLGWEPQWLLIKNTAISVGWVILDAARTPNSGTVLLPNTSSVEISVASLSLNFNSTGFQVTGASNETNQNGRAMIYMAIRAEGA